VDVKGMARIVGAGGGGAEWKDKARALMHQVVDDIFDKTQFAEKTKRHINDVIRAYNERLRKLVVTGQPITIQEYQNANFQFHD